jgi:flagellum-specific ATP synthase
LVSRGYYPPVDVLESLSRTMPATVDENHLRAAMIVRKYLAIFEENEELIRLGAYKKGADPEVDIAIDLRKKIETLLRQERTEFTPFEDSTKALINIAAEALQMEKGSTKPPS